jgi:hypothetical protein
MKFKKIERISMEMPVQRYKGGRGEWNKESAGARNTKGP